MNRVIYMLLDAAIASIVLIPLFRVLDCKYFHNTKRTVLYFFFAVYLSGVYAVVGLPDIRYIRFDLRINLIPFAYMFSDYKNSLLNVLLFIPLGFLLPILWLRFRKLHWTLLFGLGLSLLIEVLQIFTFRATDINDLMTNTTGTLVGWCLGYPVARFRPQVPAQEKTREVFLVCGIAFGVMFLLQPFLSDIIFPLIPLSSSLVHFG